MATNWAGNVKFGDSRVLLPTTVGELQAMVRDSRRVRARGTAHSFSHIADTTDACIKLDSMPHEISIDPEKQVVTVSAHTQYGNLATRLHAEGWAVHNLASLPHISVGGAIATGTHGSGVTNGNLSTSVRGLHLVAADGSLRILRAEDGDDFFGCVVGLGLCGVVARVELAIEPTFDVAQTVYPDVPRDAWRRDFDAIMGLAYSVSYFTPWGPGGAGDVWAKCRLPETAPDALCGVKAETAEECHPVRGLDGAVCTPQRGAPGPWHLRLPHFRMEHTPSHGDELQSEFFVHRRDAVAALEKLEEIAPDFHEHLWVSEVRTVAADGLWMSGGFGQPAVGIHFTWKQVDEAYECIRRVEALLAPFDHRPHFGKVYCTPREHLERVYPLDRFRELVLRLDPDGKFGNAEWDRLLERSR